MKTHIPVLVAILVATISVGCRKATQVSGGMAPTSTNNEQVTINYLAYAGSSPRRWEVVALRGPSPTLPINSMFLKRVIALPGETISLCSTGIVVNGTLLNMPAAVSNIYCPPERLPSSPGLTMVSFFIHCAPEALFRRGRQLDQLTRQPVLRRGARHEHHRKSGRQMKTSNNWVQATPDCACCLFLSQRSGAPDPERYV
jgi:hypothetical protein